MKVLVVEDDDALREALLELLHGWGYALAAAADGPAALAITAREPIDLLLLDVALPGCDGLTVCRELRRRPGHQPLVLMLTARDASADKVRGLELGADDYVVKPFDPPVLRARLQALLRRRDRPLSTELRWGALALVPGQTCLQLAGASLELTRKEALLLETLLRAGGHSCSKAQLLDASADGRRLDGGELRGHDRTRPPGATSDAEAARHGVAVRPVQPGIRAEPGRNWR
mgnify:CR=1 FL=1